MAAVDYDEISKSYDDVRDGDIALINHLLQELPRVDSLTILDIGCGTGNYTDLFHKLTRTAGYLIHGIDPSEGMLAKARRKNDQIDFQNGTAAQIPFKDDHFGFIYMTDVIHHVPDIHCMFTEIRRVLKPGGKACIGTQSHDQIDARPITHYFPGTATENKTRYPEIDEIITSGRSAGLSFLKQELLFEGDDLELGASYLELVKKKGYSMLHLITEGEYRLGLHELERDLQNGPIRTKSAGETLVWFEKE